MGNNSVLYPVYTWNDAIVTASTNLLNGIAIVVPNIIGAIVVIILGWIIAMWVGGLCRILLNAIRFDSIASRVGVNTLLSEAGLKHSAKEIVTEIIRWFIIVSFVLAGLSILGLPAVNEVLNGIVGYIPRVIAAVLILAGGLLLANFVSELIRGSMQAMRLTTANFLGHVTKWILIVFTVLAVIRQLEIVPDLINIVFMGIVGALALGFGLMVGLGGKDVANDIMRDWYEKMKRN